MPNYKEVITMTDEQLDELDRQIETVLLNHLSYLDLGNPVIPEIIHSIKEDIKEVMETILKGRWWGW